MIILDTNVLSEPLRPCPSLRVLKWLDGQPPDQLFTTAITEAEILFGISVLPKGKRQTELRARAETLFGRLLQARVLSFDSKAAHAYAEVASFRRSIGRPMSPADAQVCAIALTSKAAIASRNIADFEGCGVELLNPWIEN